MESELGLGSQQSCVGALFVLSSRAKGIPTMARIQSVRWHHDMIIDMMIANPSVTQGELAVAFGFTEPWVSNLINSDAFKHRLKERKAEIVDPSIMASVQTRMETVSKMAMDKLAERLDTGMPFSNDELIAIMDKTGKYLIQAPEKAKQGVPSTNLYFVQAPPVAADAASWAAQAGGKVVEVDSDGNPLMKEAVPSEARDSLPSHSVSPYSLSSNLPPSSNLYEEEER